MELKYTQSEVVELIEKYLIMKNVRRKYQLFRNDLILLGHVNQAFKEHLKNQ